MRAPLPSRRSVREFSGARDARPRIRAAPVRPVSSGHLLGELKDPQRARELLLRDIHSTGLALRKKSVFLRLAYLFLAVGVIVTIISYFLVRTTG